MIQGKWLMYEVILLDNLGNKGNSYMLGFLHEEWVMKEHKLWCNVKSSDSWEKTHGLSLWSLSKQDTRVMPSY